MNVRPSDELTNTHIRKYTGVMSSHVVCEQYSTAWCRLVILALRRNLYMFVIMIEIRNYT